MPIAWNLDELLDFEERCFVEQDGHYILVNSSTNEKLVDLAFDKVRYEPGIGQLTYFVKMNSKWGLFNIHTLTFQLECEYDDIVPVYKGEKLDYYCIECDGKVGAVDSVCTFVIDAEYDKVEKFRHNAFLVYSGELCGLNASGKLIIPVQYQSIVRCHEKYLVQYDDKWGLYTKDGQIEIPCCYDEITELNAGLLRLRMNEQVLYRVDPKHKQYVDLGLSVKWAVCDLPGTYSFASLNPVDETFDENTPYLTKAGVVAKYNNYFGNGDVDFEKFVRPEDDAATVFLGENWRMPTGDEIRELIEKCSWNIGNGHEVEAIGPNGQSILLPLHFRSSEANFPKSSVFHFCVHGQRPALSRHAGRDLTMNIRPVYDDRPRPSKNPFEGLDLEAIQIESDGFVNMGLSVKWAARNLGAANPAENGDYYRWGDIHSTYEVRERPTKYEFSKYNAVDKLLFLEPEDDAATQSLGEGYRMPTEDEMLELCVKCCWLECTLCGHEGFKVVGPSGKAIFIPVIPGNRNVLWTSSLADVTTYYTDEGPYMLSGISLNLHDGGLYSEFRNSTLNIRPVCK